MAGFHQGSIKKTEFASARFRPTPPAFREIKKTFTFGLALKL
jgi:hypothetical protein